GGAVTTTSPSSSRRSSAARARATVAASARTSSDAGRCDVFGASLPAADEEAERRAPAAEAARGTHPAPSPRKDPLLASAGQVFWLGDHPRPVPSHPEGQWSRPGSSPLTAAGQRGLRTPFPDPTDVESRSSARVRALSRCLALPRRWRLGGWSLHRPARRRHVALDAPAGGLEAPDGPRASRARRARRVTGQHLAT